MAHPLGQNNPNSIEVNKGPVLLWHKLLLAADRAYINNPTYENHRNIVTAQRTYYALLSQYTRNTQPYATTLRKRARWIWERTQLNLKRERMNPAWQSIALHQWRRASRIRLRANAVADAEDPPTPPRARKQRSLKVRQQHPVTGRYIYVDRTE